MLLCKTKLSIREINYYIVYTVRDEESFYRTQNSRKSTLFVDLWKKTYPNLLNCHENNLKYLACIVDLISLKTLNLGVVINDLKITPAFQLKKD